MVTSLDFRKYLWVYYWWCIRSKLTITIISRLMCTQPSPITEPLWWIVVKTIHGWKCKSNLLLGLCKWKTKMIRQTWLMRVNRKFSLCCTSVVESIKRSFYRKLLECEKRVWGFSIFIIFQTMMRLKSYSIVHIISLILDFSKIKLFLFVLKYPEFTTFPGRVGVFLFRHFCYNIILSMNK